MNTSIRKDNKVSAHTANNVLILGTVLAVSGKNITVVTDAGIEHTVLKTTTTKLSAVEFKAQVLEMSQPKVAVKAKKVANTTKISKKAKALLIFKANINIKRKDIINVFMNEVGLSAAGASTYYQNFKSGTWTVS